MTLQEALTRALEIPPKKEEISGIEEERNNFIFTKKKCFYKKPKIIMNGFFDPKERNGAVKIIKMKEKNMKENKLKESCQYKILEMISQLKTMTASEIIEMLTPEFKISTLRTTLSKFSKEILTKVKSGSRQNRKTVYTYVGTGNIISEAKEYAKNISSKRSGYKKLKVPKVIKKEENVNFNFDSEKPVNIDLEMDPKKEVEVPIIMFQTPPPKKPDNIDLISKMMQEISEIKKYILSFEISVKQQEVKMVKILQNLIIKNKNISDDELEILKM